MQDGMPFSKMHGLGNDFVVVDARNTVERDWAELAREMCDRHFGIGADQLLLVCGSRRADVKMRLFNTDGFEAEMCGNGIRCVGKYVYERGIVRSPELSIETLGGIKHLELRISGNLVTGARVAMGVPRILFPRTAVDVCARRDATYRLELLGVDMGNPHAVAIVDTPVDDFPLEQIGPVVECHPMFPARTNFEVASITSERTIDVRVWERSAGMTLACGTGACAATVAARMAGRAGDEVEVTLPGGTLTIAWDGAGEVFMTGPATQVFDGCWFT